MRDPLMPNMRTMHGANIDMSVYTMYITAGAVLPSFPPINVVEKFSIPMNAVHMKNVDREIWHTLRMLNSPVAGSLVQKARHLCSTWSPEAGMMRMMIDLLLLAGNGDHTNVIAGLNESEPMNS